MGRRRSYTSLWGLPRRGTPVNSPVMTEIGLSTGLAIAAGRAYPYVSGSYETPGVVDLPLVGRERCSL